MAAAKKSRKKEPKKIGPPTKYLPIFEKMARRLCMAGYTNEELAKHFEVNIATFQKWLKEHPALKEAVQKGRLEDVLDVVQSTYGSCHDRTVKEKRAVKLKDVEYDDEGRISGVTERVEMVEETRVIPGDPRAQQFTLRNRQPDKWTEKTVVETSGDALPVVIIPGAGEFKI